MTPHTDPPEQRPVVVTIDPSRAVSVHLDRDWRRKVGVAGLPVATLASLALAARELALSELTAGTPTPRPPNPLPGTQLEQDEILRRAFRDLAEFRVALTALNSSERTIADPTGQVTVTIRNTDIASIRLDADWIEWTNDAAVERALSTALSEAVRQIRERPAQALTGCPDLQAVIRAAGSPLADLGRGAKR